MQSDRTRIRKLKHFGLLLLVMVALLTAIGALDVMDGIGVVGAFKLIAAWVLLTASFSAFDRAEEISKDQ